MADNSFTIDPASNMKREMREQRDRFKETLDSLSKAEGFSAKEKSEIETVKKHISEQLSYLDATLDGNAEFVPDNKH